MLREKQSARVGKAGGCEWGGEEGREGTQESSGYRAWGAAARTAPGVRELRSSAAGQREEGLRV